MDRLITLEKKINELIEQLSALKKENDKIKSEIRYMEDENTKAKKLLQQHRLLSDEKIMIRKKLSGMLDKFQRLKI